jgi:hypothetical protein
VVSLIIGDFDEQSGCGILYILSFLDELDNVCADVTMYKLKKHRTHVPAKRFRHRARGTVKQTANIARKLRIPIVQ